MSKENLFVYEEDGFCELRYTYGDLTKFERKAKKYNKLQSNWNKLKQYIKEIPEEEFVNCEGYVNILDKMNELEREG